MARQPRFFVPGEVLHVIQRGNNREPMVGHPGEYRWTSYPANAQGAPDILITRHELYERLGHSGPERQRSYRQLFRAQLSGVDMEAIREATNKNWALGSERFNNGSR